MLSGGDAWTVITQNRIIDADSHLVCLAETPPTIPEEIWNETWSEEYGPEMEPLNSDKYETCSIGRSLEVPDVVKKKQCMIYKLPPELIGLILATSSIVMSQIFAWSVENVHLMVSRTYSRRGKLDLAFAAK